MPWKTDDNGALVVTDDGMPILVRDGKDVPVNGDDLFKRVEDLKQENVDRRLENKKLKEFREHFVDIDDPQDFLVQVQKDRELIKNLDDKKLVDAGEVERIKKDATAALEARLKDAQAIMDKKLAEKDKESEELRGTLHRTIIGGSFAKSEFIKNKMAENYYPEVVERLFGDRFTVEDGKAVAVDAQGKRITSLIRPGEYADFEESLERIVNEDPHRDHMLRATGGPGTGTTPGSTGGAGSTKTMQRAQFDKLDPVSQMNFIKDGGKLND